MWWGVTADNHIHTTGSNQVSETIIFIVVLIIPSFSSVFYEKRTKLVVELVRGSSGICMQMVKIFVLKRLITNNIALTSLQL